MMQTSRACFVRSILAAGLLLFVASAAEAESLQASATATTDPWYIGPARELTWNYSLAMIKAPVAFSRGYTGAGQIVAVFDSGLDTKNNQFKGRIAGPGYDAVTGRVGVTTDSMWHGTFVSGIIAPNRDGIGMVGVPYGAKLLPVRIVNANGSITVSDAQLATGIRYATQAGARIFNNSWNTSTSIQSLPKATLNAALPSTLSAYRAAVSAGAIIVFAVGNDGKSEPGLYAALPYYYPELRPGWLAAVALDSSGAIASYSNRCGSAAAWCLSAPGTNIISVYNGGYGMASGTSFAAPELSAAAAVLKQEFPYLTNQQILAILFQSANKSGIYANSAIYGQGLLDLDRATQPIGTLMVKSGGAQPVTLASTSMVMGAAFGNGFVKAVSDEPLVAQDDFGRGYATPLADLVVTGASAFDLAQALDSFGARLQSEQTGDAVLSVSYRARLAEDGLSARAVPERFFMATETQDAYLSAGFNVEPSLAFDARDGVDRADLVSRAAVSLPYLDFAADNMSFAFGRQSAQGGETRLVVFGGRTLAAPLTLETMINPALEPKAGSASGFAGMLRLPVAARIRIGLQGGAVVEEGTMLGTMSFGALSFAKTSATYFTGLTAGAALGGGVSLFGGAHFGVTEARGDAASLIASASSILTESFNVGVAKSDVIRIRDRAGLVFSEPLRVVGGAARLSLPVAMDLSGGLVEQPLDASLKADGRELDFQGFYATPLGARAEINFGAMLRFEPDHTSDAKPDGVVMTRYRLAL
jgi:hypothetical protein